MFVAVRKQKKIEVASDAIEFQFDDFFPFSFLLVIFS